MAELEKVIKGLECCATNRMRREDCEAMDCAYLDLEEKGCIHQLIRDALALLKVQEPVKPVMCTAHAQGANDVWYECSGCGGYLGIYRNSKKRCDKCGMAVKWDG